MGEFIRIRLETECWEFKAIAEENQILEEITDALRNSDMESGFFF